VVFIPPTRATILVHGGDPTPEGAAPPVWPGPFQFVTGPAGTGKTTLARQWRDRDAGFLLCATTGIAAVNLGDAVTVHSTLRFYDTASLEESFINGFLQGRMRRLRASGVTRYGIDEVSMLPARVLTLLTHAVEELNSDAAVRVGHEPAIGITVIGDFLQLPPVKAEYAFESPEWPKYDRHTLRLTDMFRQTEQEFVQALRAVRVGDADRALAILRPHMEPTLQLDYAGVTILSKNQQVDRYNKLRHDELPGTAMTFRSVITGEPLREWQKHIPIAVQLKPGARVMILANKYLPSGGDEQPELIYANGDVGHIIDGDPEKKIVQVQLLRTGGIVTVGYNVRQNLRPTGAKGKKKDRYEVLGEISYMPLRIAYASTTHKSQGLTLDRVQIDISDPFFASPAMVYVALSRARSLEGLRLVGNPELLRKRCTVDPKVERWK
jgi:ATP-dependent DNA helicase PIF1